MNSKETMISHTSKNHENTEKDTDDSNSRTTITSAINELVAASQRTKYEEAVLYHERKLRINLSTRSSNEEKRRRIQSTTTSTSSSSRRTCTDILLDLVGLMHLVTDEEYAFISRLVSLCLLAQLMPRTCHFVHTFSDQSDAAKEKVRAQGTGAASGSDSGSRSVQDHSFLEIEEILDKSPQIRHLPSSQFDPCAIEDERISSCFWNFVNSGLGAFLSSRPMSRSLSTGQFDTKPNCGSADLLHVLSLAISGDISKSDDADETLTDENGNPVKFVLSNRVKRFITKRQSDYFQITAQQRANLVNIVANTLVLPKINVPLDVDTELFGGILHLRATIECFSRSALSTRQVVDATKLLVWSAIDTECFAYTQMKELVKSLSTNKAKGFGDQCDCRSHKDANCPQVRELKTQNKRFFQSSPTVQVTGSTHRQRIIRQQSLDKALCIHCNNGDLLCDLILRYNGSRHYADGKFTGQALAELTVAIATLLGEIDGADKKDIDVASLPTACTVASLIDAARVLFYFLLCPDDKDSLESEAKGAQELENGMKDALLGCVLQLLASNDRCVSAASSSLLALAFAYENDSRITGVTEQSFITLSSHLRTSSSLNDYCGLIEVLAKRSRQFSASIVQHFIKLLESEHLNDDAGITSSLRMLCVISSHQPRIVFQQLGRLKKLVESLGSNEAIAKQFAAIWITCHGLNYTETIDSQNVKYFEEISSLVSSPWSMFQLGRLALVTSNFQVAVRIFEKHLSSKLSSVPSFLWVSSLTAVAKAELLVSQEGCKGIPTALCHLDTALSKIQSMEKDTPLQIELLSLRKDFLQLYILLSNFCEEVRLTNMIGSRNNRNHLHQQNASRCFYMLGARYISVYKRYGIFCCQHTRTSIRSYFSVCRFLGDVVGLCFNTSQKHSRSPQVQLSLNLPQGDKGRVQVQVIQKLRSELIDSYDNSLEPSVRVDILLQIANTILKCPNPYPKSFTNLQNIPKMRLQVGAKNFNTINQSFTVLKTQFQNRISFGQPFHLRLKGNLPQTLFTKLHAPFSQILAHLSICFGGPLQRDIDAEDAVGNTEKGNEVEDSNTIGTSKLLPASSTFVIDCECPSFKKEGYYNIGIILMVRDIRCGEYELNTNLSDERIKVRVGT